MTPATLRLVLLVSCTHAMVHIFELALPAVEQTIGDELQVSTEVTGQMGLVWRLPFGLGAILAGWLADRYGSRRMLALYLFGCAATSLVVSRTADLTVLFAAFGLMGAFASIYHPAGLAVISRETNPATRGAALGWHGIFGSLGIAGSPFLVGQLLRGGWLEWRGYYVVLAALGVFFGLAILFRLRESARPAAAVAGADPHPEDHSHLGPFLLLVTTGIMEGITYSALMHFLPRYLGHTRLAQQAADPAAARALLAGLVLVWGILGQWIAGKLCRPGRLEGLLTGVLLLNIPCLAWMALADGETRLAAACLTAVAHFMHQPVFNSLIAQYVPRARRSLGYGFSNMMSFAVGASGPWVAGIVLHQVGEERGFFWVYAGMAGLTLVAATLAGVLGLWMKSPKGGRAAA